jgi:hypothetical protein
LTVEGGKGKLLINGYQEPEDVMREMADGGCAGQDTEFTWGIGETNGIQSSVSVLLWVKKASYYYVIMRRREGAFCKLQQVKRHTHTRFSTAKTIFIKVARES